MADNNDNKEKKSTVDKAANAVETVKKIKRFRLMVTILPPVIWYMFISFIIILLLMIPMMLIQEIKDWVAKTTNKIVNFVSGKGFATSDDVFFGDLKDFYLAYDKIDRREGEFDSPLLAATVHYRIIISPEGYENEEYSCSEEDKEKNNCGVNYEYDDEDPVIKPNQLYSFYNYAYESVFFDSYGNRFNAPATNMKLIGNLVDTKYRLTCVDPPEEWDSSNEDEWSKLTEDSVQSFKVLWEDFKTATGAIISPDAFYQLIHKMAAEGDNFVTEDGVSITQLSLDANPIARLFRIVKQSDFSNTCFEGQLAIPVPYYFMNYDLYKEYLKKYYLPNMGYNTCLTCDFKMAKDANDEEKMDNILNQQIEEIFDYKEAYNYLKGDGSSQLVGYIPGMATLPIKPAPGSKLKITSPYGWRMHPIYGELRFHNGIDLGYALGTPVYAIANGYVLGARFNGGFGNYVKLGHDINKDGTYEYYSIYAHLSVINVKENVMIGGGQQIGEVGSTGASKGAHLHFEIRDADGNPIDPKPILDGLQNGTSQFGGALGETVYYNQSDYGSTDYCTGMKSNGKQATIWTSGCLPTSYAMILSKFSGGVTKDPAYVGNYICNNAINYRIEGGGTSSGFLTDSSVENYFGIDGTLVSKSEATLDKISSLLRAGHSLIAGVRGGYFNESKGGHYIVLDYIDENNNIKILDPGGWSRNKLYTQYDLKEKLVPYITTGVWYFERK